jgi:hypothetical protein
MDWQISFVFRVPDGWDQGKEVHDRLDALVAVIPPELWASFAVFVTNITQEDPCRKTTDLDLTAFFQEPLSAYSVVDRTGLCRRLEEMVSSTFPTRSQPLSESSSTTSENNTPNTSNVSIVNTQLSEDKPSS